MAKIIVFLVIIVSGVLLAIVFPITEWLQAAVLWIQENPAFSYPVFVLLYAAATVLMLPGSVLTLAAGFVFGLGKGVVIISVSSVLGATLAFLVGRYVARDWVLGKIASVPRFQALDSAIGQHAALVVLLTRLSPLFPYNLLNYALGLTQVRLATYVLVSWVGMMPGTFLYVYLGYAGSDLADLFSGEVGESPYRAALFYVGLAASLALVFWIARISSRLLDTQLNQSAEPESAVREREDKGE